MLSSTAPSATVRSALPTNADRIRQEVERFRRQGLLLRPGDVAPVTKVGTQATSLNGVRSVWMSISPEMAKRWLANCRVNRSLDRAVVVAFARDMKNGEWQTTHQGIAFDDRNALIDGQHRLHAIILANVTICLMVTFDLPSRRPGQRMTTMDAVDRGRHRSVADQLRIQHGMADARIKSAICASLGGLCFGERTRRMSVGQTLAIQAEFAAAIEWIVEHRPTEKGLRSVGILAGFVFALASQGDASNDGSISIQEMFLSLIGGKTASPRQPMHLLRAFLTSDESILLSRSSDRGLAELVLQAIHLQRQGQTPAKLTLVPDGWQHFRGAQSARVQKIAALFQLPDGVVTNWSKP